MLPLHLAGLALAGRTLYTQYQGKPKKDAGERAGGKKYKLRSGGLQLPQLRIPQLKLPQIKLPALDISKSTVESFFRNVTSAASNLGKSLVKDDYSKIVRPFIPGGAKLVAPQFPADSGDVLAADLDGDGSNELAASYSYGSGIRTIVLKRLSEGWYMADEIDSPGATAIKYRNAAEIAGDGKKQLLLGFPGKDRSVLHGYRFGSDTLTTLFTKEFNRFELVENPAGSKKAGQAHLAVWTRLAGGEYDIDLLRWNGLELESLSSIKDYYAKSVVPYQARLVKHNPYQPAAWYNLASSLEKSGAASEAGMAARMGTSMDRKAEYRDKFAALRQRVGK